jgi:dipeptidyl aminopeptidase/acylaminoacyl peptidase
LFVVMPIGVAVYLLDKAPRPISDAALGVRHENVTLKTSDGIHLAAWYVPSRNGAAVVLVHGAGGDRMGGVAASARLLARRGYGVLLYDARGDGASGGRPESIGWTWYRDAEAAVDFLSRRRIRHIGALGLSTGAETVLETAGRDRRIDAVVAEGAQTRSIGELRALPGSLGNTFYKLYWGATITAYRVLSNEKPSPSLSTEIARIAPRPVFLISSGESFERDANRLYARQARGPVTLWELPNGQHTRAQQEHPEQYEQRVLGFFDRALRSSS